MKIFFQNDVTTSLQYFYIENNNHVSVMVNYLKSVYTTYDSEFIFYNPNEVDVFWRMSEEGEENIFGVDLNLISREEVESFMDSLGFEVKEVVSTSSFAKSFIEDCRNEGLLSE